MSIIAKQFDQGYEVSEFAETATFEFCYPRSDKGIQFLEVSLMDVRAADSIRVHYDFGRDGWAVEQASNFDGGDPDWQEVAFVQAWGRERKKEG